MLTVPLLALLGLLTVAALFTVRGPWRTPARGVAAVLIAIGLAVPFLFRLKGLTGDFYPVLEYRFAAKHDTTLPALPGAAEPSEPSSRADDIIATARSREGAKDATEPTEPASAEAAAGKPEHPQHPALRSTRGTPAPGTPAPGTPAPGTSAPGTPAPGTSAHLSFPQFLGPSRTGVIAGVQLGRDWAAHPPKLIWKIPVGAGMVWLCDRPRAGDHAGAAGWPGDGRGLRPSHRRAAVVPWRRDPLRLGHRRRRPACDADHLGRLRRDTRVHRTAQRPRLPHRSPGVEHGHRRRQPGGRPRVGPQRLAVGPRRQGHRERRRSRGQVAGGLRRAHGRRACGAAGPTAWAMPRRSY